MWVSSKFLSDADALALGSHFENHFSRVSFPDPEAPTSRHSVSALLIKTKGAFLFRGAVWFQIEGFTGTFWRRFSLALPDRSLHSRAHG